MPFLSIRDNREASQNIIQSTPIQEASFSETFAAGVGQVFDEDLSISSMLNMEGFRQRKSEVKALGDSGAFNISEYTSGVGDVDYAKIEKDFPDFNLKSDQTLFDERSALLKQRRNYAQDVFERGNGMAQFMGMMTGYMLDPINIATMPIATAGTSLKGLSTLGRAITVGRNEAGLAIAAELMIQPLVYQHKHDINSPFEFKDALINIVTAATGAAALGGLTGGISGYFKAVREKTADLPLDDKSVMALQAMARVEDDLNNINIINENNKGPVFFHGTNKDFAEFKIVDDGNFQKLGKGIYLSKDVKVSERFAKGEGGKVIESHVEGKLATLEEYNAIKKSLSGSLKKGHKKDMETINQKLRDEGFDGFDAGSEIVVFNPENIKIITGKKLSNEEMIARDAESLTVMNTKMQESNQPSKIKENYIAPERVKPTSGTITQREREVLERSGLSEAYDRDIALFNALDNARIIQDDELVDAAGFMKSIDDEMKGIDEVITCAI